MVRAGAFVAGVCARAGSWDAALRAIANVAYARENFEAVWDDPAVREALPHDWMKVAW